ncbi:MAG TPA: XRE family transcriptional regulator [Solirubrobacteraceae bacterium]|nr:XRE family transcriptional regulator [Solirubrobacteraceae bacterium]
MEAAALQERPEDEIGKRLRAKREERGLSLRKLAARLEISPSALSQIETGRSRPSVSTLYAIVNELGISFDELFPPAPGRSAAPAAGEPGAITLRGLRHGPEELVQRMADRKVIEMASGVTWERLNPTGDRDVDFLEATYDVDGASSAGDTFMRHSGREYGLILSGRLRVTVGFDEYELEPGDSICFDSQQPHRLATIGEEPVKAIWFVIGRHGSDARAEWGDA